MQIVLLIRREYCENIIFNGHVGWHSISITDRIEASSTESVAILVAVVLTYRVLCIQCLCDRWMIKTVSHGLLNRLKEKGRLKTRVQNLKTKRLLDWFDKWIAIKSDCHCGGYWLSHDLIYINCIDCQSIRNLVLKHDICIEWLIGYLKTVALRHRLFVSVQCEYLYLLQFYLSKCHNHIFKVLLEYD